jgi:hypothetical protein
MYVVEREEKMEQTEKETCVHRERKKNPPLRTRGP